MDEAHSVRMLVVDTVRLRPKAKLKGSIGGKRRQ